MAAAFDGDGNLWICQDSRYNAGMLTQIPGLAGGSTAMPGSQIVKLESSHHDGRFDRRVVWLDGLNEPRGIAIVHDGVLIADPPFLWLARDAHGTGKCDEKPCSTAATACPSARRRAAACSGAGTTSCATSRPPMIIATGTEPSPSDFRFRFGVNLELPRTILAGCSTASTATCCAATCLPPSMPTATPAFLPRPGSTSRSRGIRKSGPATRRRPSTGDIARANSASRPAEFATTRPCWRSPPPVRRWFIGGRTFRRSITATS